MDLRDPAFYASWSEEELEAHIKALRDILSKKQGLPTAPAKERLLEFFNPAGANFMGSGMSLAEWSAAHTVTQLQNVLTFQERPEIRRRLDLIIELGAEYKAIEAQTRFSTSFAKAVIEDIIKGDWFGVRITGESLRFEDEHPETRDRYAPIYKRFSELAMKAFNTRPGAEDVSAVPKN